MRRCFVWRRTFSKETTMSTQHVAPEQDAPASAFIRADRITGVLLILLGVATLYGARDFPTTAVVTDIGAGAFPSAYAWLLIVLALLLISNSLRQAPAMIEGGEKIPASRPNLVTPAIGAATTLAYIVVIPYVGYLVATPLFMFCLMRVLGLRRVVLGVLVALGTSAILYLVFDIGMSVALPVGTFFE
jgi:putative tricarboxylic transport membrane protein